MLTDIYHYDSTFTSYSSYIHPSKWLFGLHIERKTKTNKSKVITTKNKKQMNIGHKHT